MSMQLLSFAYMSIVAAQLVVVKTEARSSPDGSTPVTPTEVKLIVAGQFIYLALTNITKASIVAQYLKVFNDASYRTLQWACYVVFSLLILSFTLGVFWGIFLCWPIKKLWQIERSGHCGNSLVYWTAAASINTGLDFLVWALPIPLVGRLKLPRRQMFWLCMLFLVGCFTCVIGIVRIIRVRDTAAHHLFAKSAGASVTWSAVEANVGIICASLILIKPLLQKWFPDMLSSSAPSRRNLHLPTLQLNGTQSSHAWSGAASHIWTCSPLVDLGRRNTASDSEGQPTSPGINVMVETTQTSQSNSRSGSRGSDLELNAAETAAPWTQAWDEQSSMKQLKQQSR
ncbi:putative inositol polyphosphate 5-phosphatase [Venturia nashicola]|uniref:Putative inositol polyphosphate 5-phosphatase n=1 Tax=Venturia nashicola TaxID=86259 RepID=A0A4Z1PL57_9PEZI|nr:putative inositol polyphosphate 5-phosphatase [Venturia nashicola]